MLAGRLQINDMIEQSGRLPMLMAIAHFFGWAEKGIGGGDLKASTEDWSGFARAMNGIAILRLNSIETIAYGQVARFITNDGVKKECEYKHGEKLK